MSYLFICFKLSVIINHFSTLPVDPVFSSTVGGGAAPVARLALLHYRL